MILFVCLWPAGAQPIITAPRPTSTNQPDPLAAFMVPQPPIDTISPIQPVVEFDPPVIREGQTSVYRVELNVMEQSVEWPDSIPTPEGCTVRKGASAQYLRNVGGAITPRTTFLYHIQPSSSGTFTMPAHTVRARGQDVQIPAVTLTVVPPGSPVDEAVPGIQLRADGTEFFVGQSIDLQAILPGRSDGTIQTLSQVKVEGEGLIVDRNYRPQRVVTQIINGVSRPVFTYHARVTPIRPGRTEVTVNGHMIGNRFQRQIVAPGTTPTPRSLPTYKLVDSEPLGLNILPLPRDSELPGFTGAIGSFTLEPPTLSTNNVQAGDLITLRLTLRGSGNLEQVLPPEMGNLPQWQVFQPRKENTLAAIIRQRGFVTFEYQLIPLDHALQATPAIPFCYFDPTTRRYVDLTVSPIPITVAPSPLAASGTNGPSLIEARTFLRERLKKQDEPTSLADTLESQGRTAHSLVPAHRQLWFAGAQLIPATLLGGLWFWDRRRRFFDQHPEVLVRRRARRAIRRHASLAGKAARKADAKHFLHHAIQGFREACAPDAPADPSALVCRDILTTLPNGPQKDRTSRVVTKLFTAANEWRFGQLQPDQSALLSLAQEVDQQLDELRNSL